MRDFSGKGVFITGAASGIGLALAHAFAARGAKIVMADIDADGVAREAEALQKSGAETLALTLDVTKEDAWLEAATKANAFAPIRVLCSNAGVGGGSGAFERYDTSVWRWAYEVNVHAQLYACRAFLGAMKDSGEPAHFVLTASMVGLVPPPLSIAYISSKYAAVGIAMGLRNELAGTNIGISMLCPGMVATNVVSNTALLRPGAEATGAAAETAAAMKDVLAAGMQPDKIAARVIEAIERDAFYIFTHPEWKRLAEPQIAEMMAAFGASADPDYKGDDIDSLLKANNVRRMNVSVDR